MSSHTPAEIFLVEDSPEDIELTLRSLRKANLTARIEVARDGAEALAFFFGGEAPTEAEPASLPKLILLDLKLPKVSGLEVLQRLKSEPRTQSIPVAILTSSKEQQDVAGCYALGANSYVVKPVNFDSFTKAVQELGTYWLLLNQPPRIEA